MILISHLNFTTKRERIPYILAFFESCLLEYLKNQVDVDKSTETQESTGLLIKLEFAMIYNIWEHGDKSEGQAI